MKKTVLLFTLLVGFNAINKAQLSAGFFTLGTIANVNSAGTASWTVPTSTFTSSQIINLPPGTLTHGLHFTNFGFNIQSAANIMGVEAVLSYCVMPQGTGAAIAKDSIVKLLVNNIATGNNLGSVHNFTPIITTYTYGASGNTWGNILTPAQVNSSNFGFVSHIKSNGTATVYISQDKSSGGQMIPKMKVYYESTTGVIESQTSSALSYYYSQVLHLNDVYENTNLQVFNLEGKKVFETVVEKDQTKVELSKLNPGVYFYRMMLGKKEVVEKILID